LNPSPALRRVLLAVAVLLLLGLTWTGLSGGLHQLSHPQSSGEKAQTFTQLAYGLFAFLSVVTTFWGRRWIALIQTCWAVSATLAAGLASVVWGGTTLGIGLLSGGAALLIALGISWLLRVGARSLTSA
jgi:hypothetical protein